MASQSLILQSYEVLKRTCFSAQNATPGTGIDSTAAPTSFSATVGLMSIYNSATTTEGSVIIPQRLRLLATQANTSATQYRLIGYLDSINRYSSGGTQLTTVNKFKTSDSSYTDPVSKATVYFGALTLAAASDADLHFNELASEAVLAAEQCLNVVFYSPLLGQEMPNQASEQVVVMAPVIGPGCTLTIHEVTPSASDDPKFEVILEYVELFL